jgi:hypothetical protein
MYLISTNFHLHDLISWSHLQVQESADCLGADCVPRDIEMKNLLGLEIDDAFQTKQKVRSSPVSLVYQRHWHRAISTLRVFYMSLETAFVSRSHGDDLAAKAPDTSTSRVQLYN